MIERALVIGGTHYFGKRLVELLLEEGTRVTVATRGRAPDSFGNRIDRITVDREEPGALARATAGRDWDVVYDQISFSPDDARGACEAFSGRTARLVHTSTQSVHYKDGPLREEDFDPRTVPLQSGPRSAFNYAEGKRQAEAVLFQCAPFPVAAARFPAVLGADDDSGRLEFHLERVREGRPIVPRHPRTEMCLIRSDEAARFLVWLGKSDFAGCIHACSNGVIAFPALLELVRASVGGTVNIAATGAAEDSSPLSGPLSRYLLNDRARALGFAFLSLDEWLPRLIEQLAGRARGVR